MRQLVGLLALLFASQLTTLAIAADDSQTCHYAPLFPPTTIDHNHGERVLEAERLIKLETDNYRLTGQASITQNQKWLAAEQLDYNATTQRAKAWGRVHLQDPDYLSLSDNATHDEKQQVTEINQLSYQLRQNDAWGTADSATIEHDNEKIKLSNLRYTGCPIGHEDWWLTMNQLEIDDKTKIASGDDVVLRFKDVPVFYLPWFKFSTADRASGLLMPTITSYYNATSTTNSVKSVLKVPYYFDIAPNMDDTLTLIQMADRGQVLDNEFRYWLTKQKGDLTLSYLNDQTTNQTRYRIWWNATQTLKNDWQLNWSWHDVSDPAFYREIQLTDYYLRTMLYLDRTLNLKKSWQEQSISFQLLDFKQMLYGQSYYSALPRITHRWQPSFFANSPFYASMTSEFSHFLQPEGRGVVPMGDRLHLSPTLGFELWQPYGFLRGKTQLLTTQYSLSDNNDNNNVTRILPLLSLDGGLTFEKPFNLADRNWVHTIEPRVKYLFVPKSNQSQLPVFDTMLRNFDYLQLFADNRFTGYDRIGDANQITTGLFSRILHDDGRELLEFGLGQISYFQSREVQLPYIDRNGVKQASAPEEKGDFSDLILTAGINLADGWRLSFTQQLDRDSKSLVQDDANLQYIGDNRDRFLIRHRLRLKGTPLEDEQITVGGQLHYTGILSSTHFINYNNTTGQLRGAINAIQYDSCCWAGQLIWEHNLYINQVQDDIIRLAFIFKGLTTFGSTADQKVNSQLYFE